MWEWQRSSGSLRGTYYDSRGRAIYSLMSYPSRYKSGVMSTTLFLPGKNKITDHYVRDERGKEDFPDFNAVIAYLEAHDPDWVYRNGKPSKEAKIYQQKQELEL
jgi:hypothetical protein